MAKVSRTETSWPLTLGRTTSVPTLCVKIIFLGLVVGFAVSLTPALIAMKSWAMLTILLVASTLLVVIYSTKKFIPAKYLFPGTFSLLVFVLIPVLFTIQISTTNYGDGTRGTKEEAVESIIANSVVRKENLPSYAMSIDAKSLDGPITVYLVEEKTGDVYSGTQEKLEKLSDTSSLKLSTTLSGKKVTQVHGKAVLSAREVDKLGDRLSQFAVPVNAQKGLYIHPSGISQAYTGQARLIYNSSSDVITDRVNGKKYTPQLFGDREFYADSQGNKVSQQSWKSSVGFSNYLKLFTNASIRSQLASTSAWTLFFAVFSVFGTFLCGLLIALLFDDSRMAGRRVWRSLMVIPYAVPTFIGFLIWSTFFNKDFGVINSVLGMNIDWLGNPSLAKVAVCTANLWAGIPYMFLISTGALQSLPTDIVEAARIDGAGPFRLFFQIKMPLLLISVAPLLVSSFAFNFNNYNAIALMTKGGPFTNAQQVFGGTDILISGIYRIAFGGSGAQFGFAAAVSVILFVITATLGAIQFKISNKFEDIR